MSALLVVGHGTRHPTGVEQFQVLIDEVRATLPGVDVVGGYLELSAPPITEAVADLVSRGHRRIVVVPLVLVAAGHAKGDVPAALARERLRHPGLSFSYGRPLGNHATVLALLQQRLEQAVPREQWPATAVALIGRGSSDPDANSDVAKAARLLLEGRSLAGVEPGFVSLAAPDVAATLQRVLRLGHRRAVVLPYFLFDGVLPDRVAAQAADFAAAHPALTVLQAGVLGPTPGLAGLVAERYAEALVGDVRANCDACMYRIALPGFESRVAAPQVPHHHPADSPHQHHRHEPAPVTAAELR